MGDNIDQLEKIANAKEASKMVGLVQEIPVEPIGKTLAEAIQGKMNLVEAINEVDETAKVSDVAKSIEGLRTLSLDNLILVDRGVKLGKPLMVTGATELSGIGPEFIKWKFQYFFSDYDKSTGTHKGAIAVASTIVHDMKTGKPSLIYGVSFCSPKDRFDKRTGRGIALERAQTLIDTKEYDRAVFGGRIKYLRRKANWMIKYQLLMDMFSNVATPRFAMKVINENMLDYVIFED